ncbi:serine/threonine protein kinase [Myxococcota bacterium]|nr:serine/threonine protein kinase [Myxococcota bacterium]
MTDQSTTCRNCGHKNNNTATYCSRCGSSLKGEDVDPFLGKYVGKIVLEKRIGFGGAGAVYQGRHTDLGKLFAVKVLRADLITDEETKARFEREARVLARLQHDNVVSIHDFGHLSGLGPYMAMEWLEGSTLFDERKKRGTLAFDEILHIFNQLTSAMYFMHTRDIVHRDLKPENMMLVSAGHSLPNQDDSLVHRKLKVFDFGIALLEDANERKLTAAGMVVGTPHYMAPEQIIIDARVDHRADLYAAGAILYEVLTGRPPFWGTKRPIEVMEKHLRHPPPSLAESCPERFFPPQLQDILNKALAKSPADRYPDARAFFEDLQLALEEGAQHESFESERTVIGGWPVSGTPAGAPPPMGSPPPMGKPTPYSPSNAPQWNSQDALPDAEPNVPDERTSVDLRRPEDIVAQIRQQRASNGNLPHATAPTPHAKTTQAHTPFPEQTPPQRIKKRHLAALVLIGLFSGIFLMLLLYFLFLR